MHKGARTVLCGGATSNGRPYRDRVDRKATGIGEPEMIRCNPSLGEFDRWSLGPISHEALQNHQQFFVIFAMMN